MNGQYGPLSNSNEFFSKVEIPFEKSKEEVWEMMASKLNEKQAPKVIRMNRSRLVFRYAAIFLFAIGVAGFFRFYSKTVDCPRGQHFSAILPDSSVVEMNAESSLKYYPLWWPVSREVKFDGEGFFKVQKGSKFRVRSRYGKTKVLGTSFNIYSRDDDYKVTCLTGQVKVVSKAKEKVVLNPKDHAEIGADGSIGVQKNYNTNESTAWMNNMFIFTSESISNVFREIERQYDVSVQIGSNIDFQYSGYFSKEKSIDDVLSLICKPFGLIFDQRADGTYIITQIN